MDKRDLALQRSCPTLSVPRFSEHERPESSGERVLIASNGTFLEVTRKWGYFVRKIGSFERRVVLPFGEAKHFTQLAMERLPRHLLDEFNELAKQSSHVEVGASIIWNEVTGQFRLAPSTVIDASAGHLRYRLPDLATGEHVVIDCHSHSTGPAFFSRTDNEDDASAVKFSYVVGNCDKTTLTAKLRLCVKGIFEDVPFDL